MLLTRACFVSCAENYGMTDLCQSVQSSCFFSTLCCMPDHNCTAAPCTAHIHLTSRPVHKFCLASVPADQLHLHSESRLFRAYSRPLFKPGHANEAPPPFSQGSRWRTSHTWGFELTRSSKHEPQRTVLSINKSLLVPSWPRC